MPLISAARAFLASTAHRISQIVSALFGLLLAISGVALAFSQEPGLRVFGLTVALAGLIVLPFVAAGLRRRLPQLQPIWALPSLACSLVVAGFVLGQVLDHVLAPTAPPGPAAPASPPAPKRRVAG
jgi:drug/metabolite transporter (DMT)-like permease